MKITKAKHKKTSAFLVFSLLLVFFVSAGTIAWLTRTNTLTNVFTVGTFKVPTTSPVETEKEITGHLFEPSWDDSEDAEHQLVPAATFIKDPYVGIGKGSEDAVVYVYIENPFSENVYFEINEGWTAVDGETTDGSKEGSYKSGLFKYTAGLTGATDKDVWTTTPLFNSIETHVDSTEEDFVLGEGVESAITVKSFIHQAKNGAGEPIDDATIILPAAKAAFGIE